MGRCNDPVCMCLGAPRTIESHCKIKKNYDYDVIYQCHKILVKMPEEELANWSILVNHTHTYTKLRGRWEICLRKVRLVHYPPRRNINVIWPGFLFFMSDLNSLAVIETKDPALCNACRWSHSQCTDWLGQRVSSVRSRSVFLIIDDPAEV